jgi:ribosome-associated toxin RatA of RatAB toxin-antitoxin module
VAIILEPDVTAPWQADRSGGRACARRIAGVITAALASVLFSAPAAARTDPAHREVTVTETGGVYQVEARFVVLQPGAVAAAVLTDYETIPRFMPDVRKSRILERSDRLVIVEQEAIARFLMFSKRVHLVLEIDAGPLAIRFRDRSGRSFTKYEGTWQIREQDNGAEITYQLLAKPLFSVPQALLKRLLQRDASEMIQRLQAEIAARAN